MILHSHSIFALFIVGAVLPIPAGASDTSSGSQSASAPDTDKNSEASTAIENCDALVLKALKSPPLTPAESDEMLRCYLEVYPLQETNGTPPGILAHQPPPEFYQQWDFRNFPGVLGGVEG